MSPKGCLDFTFSTVTEITETRKYVCYLSNIEGGLWQTHPADSQQEPIEDSDSQYCRIRPSRADCAIVRNTFE